MAKYYILTAKAPDGTHELIFGDYECDLVEQEIINCRDYTEYDEYSDYFLHTLEDDNIAFRDFLDNLNSDYVQSKGI